MEDAKLLVETKEYGMERGGRSATIIFTKKDEAQWELEKCKYFTMCISYDFEDWMFLGEVSREIERIETSLNV